jgi:hypothetical protein
MGGAHGNVVRGRSGGSTRGAWKPGQRVLIVYRSTAPHVVFPLDDAVVVSRDAEQYVVRVVTGHDAGRTITIAKDALSVDPAAAARKATELYPTEMAKAYDSYERAVAKERANSASNVAARSQRFGNAATGNFRVDAFLDGEPFAVIVKKGQAPRAAVTHSLGRRLAAAVTLWPAERTPAGEMFTAKWYDPKTETFREASVEIWDAIRRHKPAVAED